MASHMGVIGCLIVVAALLHGVTAQDTYVVLDNSGWTVPTNGDAAYRTWAAGKEFEVGDTLVFNFPTGRHDVAEVTKAAYDTCNGTSPISSQTTGPANITIQTGGDHYYICTVEGHCQGGQKLAINVATDEPDSYVVLDNSGWTVPSNGERAYQTWTAGKDFKVGDTLVFNFPTGRHDVAEVSGAAYDSCNGTNPIFSQSTGPANITLRTSGVHYYICTVEGHCQGGQKLTITVGTSSGTNTPPPSPPSGPSPPSSAASIVLGGFVSTLLSTAIAFLC